MMKNLDESLCLYVVTDSKWSTPDHPLLESVREALQGGATSIQIREKQVSTPEFIAIAQPIVSLCHDYGVPCIINDNLEVALATGADGLHIGQDDGDIHSIRMALGPNRILGVSAHSLEEAEKAYFAGADYLGVGHIFPTSTKLDSVGVSRDTLRAIVSSVPIPVVAIGGISLDTMDQLMDTGIAGVALVSAVLASSDILSTTVTLAEKAHTLFRPLPPVLTIAGSDSSGGAGIQADLKAMQANDTYGMSVITAVTAQNTQGVKHIEVLSNESIRQQLAAIEEDIMPRAIKIGMLATKEVIHVVSEGLISMSHVPTVVDPVMVATSGAILLENDAIQALERELLPYADLLTPNIPEAELLSGQPISGPGDMEKVAQQLGQTYACAVLLKGGHGTCDANDFLWTPQGTTWLLGKRIANDNTHGTGCTLSSAIAANLAKGCDLLIAVKQAKDYLSQCLRRQLNLGQGSGPLHH